MLKSSVVWQPVATELTCKCAYYSHSTVLKRANIFEVGQFYFMSEINALK